MRAVTALFAALVLFGAMPADTSGQTLGPIGAELQDWADAMDRFRFGPRSCPALVDKVQDVIGGIVGAAGSDTGWEWVEDLGRGVHGHTHIQHNPANGDVVPNFRDHTHPTKLSKAEIGNGSTGRYSDYFLWGVAHEALHWVNPVGVNERGERVEDHLGPDWERLDDCFADPA